MLSRMAVKVVNIGKGLVAASTPATKVTYQGIWKLSPQKQHYKEEYVWICFSILLYIHTIYMAEGSFFNIVFGLIQSFL